MLVAACVCPHPPVLIPAMTLANPPWLVDLRLACAKSVRRLAAPRADRIVAVGLGPESGEWDESAGGTLRGFGVDAASGGADIVLPLSLTVAAHLLDESGWAGRREYVALAEGQGSDESERLGRELVAGDERVALLVMGDGSSKRSTEAPGYFDERAQAFDTAVVIALREVDPEALLAIDPQLARELWVAGRESWQLLAGAVRAVLEVPPGGSDRSGSSKVAARVGYADAPLGVGYFVVDWSVEPATAAGADPTG